MMIPTYKAKSSELRAGMVVHHYGARFRLRDDRAEHAPNAHIPDSLTSYTITGDWMDGATIRGYFGPDRAWHFQGNDLAVWTVERAD